VYAELLSTETNNFEEQVEDYNAYSDSAMIRGQ
jgi:group II intron reverse transcriptase/maturase